MANEPTERSRVLASWLDVEESLIIDGLAPAIAGRITNDLMQTKSLPLYNHDRDCRSRGCHSGWSEPCNDGRP